MSSISDSSSSLEASTAREAERARETQEALSVIIKRNEEVLRHPDDTLETAIHEGLEQIRRPTISLALSSVAAGLILGFSVMAVAVVTQTLPESFGQRLGVALVYPLGFIICIMSGSQLFTEHTATAVYPVLDRRAQWGGLLRLWGIVIAGNLVGAFISGGLLILVDDVVNAREGYLLLAEHLTHFETQPLFISAILAGWLMAQGGWLLLSTPSAFGQIICIFIVTFLIGFGGLHHSIAGSVEIFTAVLASPDYTPSHAAAFLGPALLGNLIGGSIFVALLNYTHIRKTQT